MKLNAPAPVPWCWYCSKKLCAGGRLYGLVTDRDGHVHAVHKTCAEREADDSYVPDSVKNALAKAERAEIGN